MKSATCMTIAMLLCSGVPVLADQGCRFIAAKADREACYARQDAQRAEKAKASEAAKRAAIATPPRTEDDRAMFRTLHSICRGC